MGIFTYVKIIAVALLVIAVGYFVWSYQGMKNDKRMLESQHVADLANLKTAETTINLLKEMTDVNEAIDNAPSDDVAEYLRTGVWPKRPDSKGDGVPAPAKPTDAQKSGQGQE